MPQLNSALPTALPPDAIPLEPVLPTAMPSDAIPLEQSNTPTAMPTDALPLEKPSDATPVEHGSTFSDLLKSITGAMFGNQVDNATPLGPVQMMDGGEFYKGQDGKLYAFSKSDFIAPDPKTGDLMAFARKPSEGELGKVRDVASAVVPGLAVTAPEGSFVRAARAGAEAAAVNETATPTAMPADAIPLESAGAAGAAETAAADTIAPAAETAASGAATGSPELQARINGLMAGDRQIMTPEQLSLLQSTSAQETKGAAAALDSSATEPIVKEGLSRNIIGAFRDMLQAGDVTMVPGIKPTDQVLALMRSNILPPETYQGILKTWGVDPTEVTQSLLGEGMRESARKAGQTLQQLSDLQGVILNKLTDTPEAKAFLAGQADDVGNAIRGVSSQVRGIYMSQLVGQLATSMRNALTATATAGVDTLARIMDGTLRTLVVNPVRQLAGAAPIDDPIGAFTNWNMLLRSADRMAGLGDKAVTPYAITKAITDALPGAREAIYGRFASDVTRAVGHEGPLGRIQQASEFLNFHGRLQEFMFRRAFFAAELSRRLEARGLNLDNLVRTNQIGRIPDDAIHGAVNEALRLTYGRPLGNSLFDNLMRDFNNLQTLRGRNPFPPVPFVRFMADALKWQFEHSPFGAARLLSRTERAALGPRGQLEVASRALTGSAMLYGAYMLRNSGMGGSEWFSAKIPGTNTSVDLRPFNPLTNYLFVADIIKRSIDGTLAGLDGKQIAQGLIGANFRAGVGLYLVDDLISNLAGNESAPTKIKNIVETWAGDTLAGFLTPFETLKDVIAQFNPEERIVRDQRQNLLLDPAKSRIPYLDQTLPPVASPTRAGPLEEAAPMVKQMTGVTVQEKKNAAETELARLNIQKKEVLPSSGDPAYDRQMATLMGPIVEKAVGNLVASPGYQKLDNATKAFVVSQLLGDIRGAAAKAMPPDLAAKQQYAKKGVRERIFLETLFNKLPPERRDLIKNLLIR